MIGAIIVNQLNHKLLRMISAPGDPGRFRSALFYVHDGTMNYRGVRTEASAYCSKAPMSL